MKKYLMDLQLFGDGDQQPEKTFTQAELDQIIGERLAREKTKYSDYDDAKAILDELKDYGYTGTPKEIREAIKQQKEAAKKEQELRDLETEANQTGTTPEILSEIKELKKELAEIKAEKTAKQKELEAQKEAETENQKQMAEFAETYPDIDISETYKSDGKFKKFWDKSNPKLTIKEVWEGYVELVGEAEAAAAKKIQSNVDRSTSSGRSKGDANAGSYGLSESQQQLAKENDMSYKEYAEFLKDIV